MTVIEKHSRMPRKLDNPPAPLVPERKPLDTGSLPALRSEDPQVILERYLSDESTETIAQSYGVTRQALGKYLLKVAEEDWKEAQVARAIARKERAEDALESATDPLSLARARELLKAAQWDLERVCRRIYGEDKAQVQIVNPVLNIMVGELRQEQKQPALARVSLAHARVCQVLENDASPASQQSEKSLTDQ